MPPNPNRERIEKLHDFLSVDETNIRVILELSQLYLESGQLELARKQIEAGLEIEPDNLNLIHLYAITELGCERYTPALRLFRSVLDIAPAEPTVSYYCALCHLHLGAPAAALPLLESAAAISQAADIKLLLARTHYQLQNYDVAIDILNAVVAAAADGSVAAHGLLGQMYLDSERWDLAEQHALAALTHDPKNTAACLTQGYICLQSSQYSDAELYFNTAITTSDNSARSHLGLAIVAMFHQHYAVAEQHLLRALTIHKESLPALNTLGWLYILLDKFEDARSAFQQGIDIDRSYGEMYGGLAVIDIILENVVSARANISKSLRLNPQSYAGNFAKILMLQKDQLPQAEKIWLNLMLSPVDGSGKTLQQAIIEQIRDLFRVKMH